WRVAAQFQRRGNCRPKQVHRSARADRDFLCTFCEDLRLLWNRGPLKFLVELEEERAVATFEGHALLFKTAEKDTAVGSVEGKKVGLANESTALFVFFFQ